MRCDQRYVSGIVNHRTNLSKEILLMKDKTCAYPSQINRTTHTIHETSHGGPERKNHGMAPIKKTENLKNKLQPT